MPHKTRESIDEQQSKTMNAEELLNKIKRAISIRIKINIWYRGQKVNARFYNKWADVWDEIQLNLINQFKADIEKNAYPNTFSKDGETECCGRCGTVI